MTKYLRFMLIAVAATWSLGAAAQYPSKPITLVVPFPPGSTTDTVARVIGHKAGEILKQPVIIENKPGAEGQIAAQDVAKAQPDGYRILLATSGNLSLLPALRRQPPYDAIVDFTPIADIGRYAFFLYVHPAVPANNMQEFIAYAKKNPGKMSYATGNNTGVVTFAQLRTQLGIDLLHVPYKGEPPAVLDLIAGRVQAMIGTTIGLPYVRSGKMRAIAALGQKRSPLFPDAMTLEESGLSNLRITPWAGVVGPRSMPSSVVATLSQALIEAASHPDVQTQMERLGFPLTPGGSRELASLMGEQLKIHARLVRDAGLQPE